MWLITARLPPPPPLGLISFSHFLEDAPLRRCASPQQPSDPPASAGKRILGLASGQRNEPKSRLIVSAEAEMSAYQTTIKSALLCLAAPIAVIVRGRSNRRRTYRGHASLDGRAAGRCTAAPRHAGI